MNKRDHDVPIRVIIEAVAEQFDIPAVGILSCWRDRRLSRPRQIAMWIARRHEGRTTTVIGRVFGRDHSTVSHDVQVVDRLMQKDALFARRVSACVEAVYW